MRLRKYMLDKIFPKPACSLCTPPPRLLENNAAQNFAPGCVLCYVFYGDSCAEPWYGIQTGVLLRPNLCSLNGAPQLKDCPNIFCIHVYFCFTVLFCDNAYVFHTSQWG
ncbi:unnamed protein product [Laminaria digitata]